MKKPPTDVGASVRARLLGLARKQGKDFQLLLTRYAGERGGARDLSPGHLFPIGGTLGGSCVRYRPFAAAARSCCACSSMPISV
jgi:hypothetical protein